MIDSFSDIPTLRVAKQWPNCKFKCR